MSEKEKKRIRRHKRVRTKISGTAQCPRLCVFRSNKHIYAQLINDKAGKTLATASDLEINAKRKTQNAKQQPKAQNLKKESKQKLTGKIATAYEVGKLIAQKAAEKKTKKVVFDRGGYKYHGRVKALAEGTRDAGLQF